VTGSTAVTFLKYSSMKGRCRTPPQDKPQMITAAAATGPAPFSTEPGTDNLNHPTSSFIDSSLAPRFG
jgi:hypothetical protein